MSDLVGYDAAPVIMFLAAGRLTGVVASLEHKLEGTTGDEAREAAHTAGFEPALLAAALQIRQDLGRINDLIHAAAISLALPKILEAGERLTNRPSLAAGDDPTRLFDLETDRRIAEFKVAIWSGKGADAMRKRGLFHDLVGLAADRSGCRAELYVAGPEPARFLQTSGSSARWALDRGSLAARQLFVEEFGDPAAVTVCEFTAGPASHVKIIDLAKLLPELHEFLSSN